MSLEASHLRFALDVMGDFKVNNLNEYLSGAIYPDSRYLTKINRELTHPDKILLPPSDFQKGWQTHLIADQLDRRCRITLFPELASIFEEEPKWVAVTAIKVVSDMDDVAYLEIEKYLDRLDYVTNPNDEDLAVLQQYNQIMINLYRHKNVPALKDYRMMWTALGIDKSRGDKLYYRVKELMADIASMEKIKMIYQKMLQAYGAGDYNKII